MDNTFTVRDRRGGKRYFIDNALLRGGWGEKLKAYGIAVYNALALHADADEQDAYPSYETIAKLTGMSRRQAIREIEKLEKYNIIRKEFRTNDSGGQTSNEYILVNKAEWIPVSDRQSPPPVTDSHPPSDSESPKQDSSKQTPLEQDSGANAQQQQNKGSVIISRSQTDNIEDSPKLIHEYEQNTSSEVESDKCSNISPSDKSESPNIPPAGQPPVKSDVPAAVVTYRSIANRYPDKSTWETIAETVGDREPDLAFWEQVVKGYILCGWNKINIDGMLKFFTKRVVPSTEPVRKGQTNGTNGHSRTAAQTGRRTGRELAAEPCFNPYTGETEYIH